MNTMRFVSLLAGVVLFGAATGLHAESPEELLARVDAQRYVPNLSFVMQMTSFEGDKQVESNTLWGFIKGVGTENRSLLAFADPASVKGRKVLMDGNIVYLLFPRTTNPIRLSPLQVLMGQASNGDVVRTGFSQDYDVASLQEADREGVHCYLFTLMVKESRKDASYKKIRLWVEKQSLRPVYAEFWTGDRLLKQAVYSDYRTALGKDLPFSVDIRDGDNPQKHTVMTYVKVGQKSVADTVFRRDYLQSWVPEQPR
jgi:outer membrane lipoprotein-sorting protein